MIKASALGLILLMLVLGSAHAQTPTGTIAGVVTDQTGAALTGARVDIVNRDTGQTRSLTTAVNGVYTAAALPSGLYQIHVEAASFKRLEREASVEAGTTTTVDLTLELGDMSETRHGGRGQPLLRHDHHQVGGVVTRDQIENLPLNGRNFLELAKLEPGVTNPARLADNRMFVSLARRRSADDPARRLHAGDGGRRHISTPGTAGVLSAGLAGCRSGISDRPPSTSIRHQPDQQRRHQHRDALRRQRVSRQRVLLPSRSSPGGVSRPADAIPPTAIRSSSDAVRFPFRWPGAERPCLLLRQLRAHGPDAAWSRFNRVGRIRAARRNLSQPLRGRSVQRARGRAAPSKPQRFVAVHA